MSVRRALVSGASIAGPAAALLLERLGWEVVVVEKAPSVRPGGQAVDFRGDVHRRLLDAMGVAEAVGAAQTGKSDWRLIRADGTSVAAIPGEFLGGDVEILRGDLARILVDAGRERCDYRFGDEILELEERPDGRIRAAFARAPAETFHLVVGADGIHSAARRIAFGAEADLVHSHGYRYAVAGRTEPSDGRRTRTTADLYSEPGRSVIEGSAKAPALFVWRTDGIPYDRRDPEAARRELARAFQGIGWRGESVLDRALASDDLFVDELARVDLDSWTRRGVALVGDAGYGNTLSGFGTGLAIVGAWVLAGELSAVDGDPVAALPNYDARMRRFLRGTRGAQAGAFLAPPSDAAIRRRERMWRSTLGRRLYVWMAEHLASRTPLPDYPALSPRISTR